MYSFPSTSKRWLPSPWATKTGWPPTLLKARTGELTPPGIISCARRNSSCDFEWFIAMCLAEGSCPGFAAHLPAESQAHADFVKAAVEIAHQALLLSQVRLTAREQVLHDHGKARAAAGELHHALRDGSE